MPSRKASKKQSKKTKPRKSRKARQTKSGGAIRKPVVQPVKMYRLVNLNNRDQPISTKGGIMPN